MGAEGEVGRWAGWSLGGALALAVVGKLAERWGDQPFLGGLVFSFGEAALVGGLADWFAVRALFAHPFGIPFPHTAIIPRNRVRIISEIRAMVQHEWLPPSLLVGKVNHFDFVGSGLMPLVETLKPHLGNVLRSAGRDVLAGIEPKSVAVFLARGLAGSIDAERIGPFLSDLARRARDRGWLEPVVREWLHKAHEWANSSTSKATIRKHLEEAAQTYQAGGVFRRLTYRLAEKVGGVDLDAAAAVLQQEMERFTAEQMVDDSPLMDTVRNGLTSLETRLRDDPEFLADVRSFILQSSETGTLTVLLEPVLTSMREEAAKELDSEDSRLTVAAVRQIDGWLQRLQNEGPLREDVNRYCRRLATQLVEQHHSLIGLLVEEQLARLSDENLAERIQARVGEDLNWIRLNGTFVGGLVGTFLYLLFILVSWMAG